MMITLFLKLDQQYRWLGEYFVLEMAYGRDAYQTLNVILGFLVVFRTQLAYQRYWEGRSTLQRMTAAWSSAFMHSCAFACGMPFRAKVKCFAAAAETEETKLRVEHNMFFNDVIHLASLLHAVRNLFRNLKLFAGAAMRLYCCRGLISTCRATHSA